MMMFGQRYRPRKRLMRRPEWTAVQRHPSGFRFPGGESFVEMQGRVDAAVRRLVGLHRGRTIVLVSHADPIRVLLAHVLGVPLDLFQRIAIAPASISAVAFHPDGATVLTMNSVNGDVAGLVGGGPRQGPPQPPDARRAPAQPWRGSDVRSAARP